MNVIGIDVGLDGAVAILPVGLFWDTPSARQKKGRDYLPQLMAEFLRLHAEGAQAAIEGQHVFAGQGRTSGGSLMKGYGLWIGLLAGVGIPYTVVAPAVWKRAMGIQVGAAKDASRLRAMQLFPQLTGQMALKKHHGRADALLIAEWLRRSERR